ncbi:MAG: hypothetical protein ACFFDP_06080 [Promethearchaeota archaeon]
MKQQSKFIGARVSVEVVDLEKPIRFKWNEKTYSIVEIEASSRRLDLRSAWFRRRHRDYFVVLVDTGQRFELYHHRGPGPSYWVLTRELSSTS